MKVHQVRLGHATNSSSTHSIVLLAPGQSPRRGDDYEDGRFGWDHFTLYDPRSKMRYLAATIRSGVEGVLGAYLTDLVVRDLCGNVGTRVDREGVAWSLLEAEFSRDDYVDHQSAIAVPVGFDGQVEAAYLRDLRDYLLRENVVVYGGNDNEEGGRAGPDLNAFYERHLGEVVARKDPAGFWTLYNRRDGAKLRLSFAAPHDAVDASRSTLPELVDVKVTDACPFGCAFCYQGSTPAGAPSSLSPYAMAESLAALRPFEVAIGGGEPTMWPGFDDLVGTLRRRGITPSFTTRSLAWLADPDRAERLLRSVGGVGFSVGTTEEIRALGRALDRHGPTARAKFALHLVMGTFDRWRLGSLTRAAKDAGFGRVLLLDFKRTGFGKDAPVEPYDWLPEELARVRKDGHHPSIGIDTPLARRFANRWEGVGIPRWLYETEEGAHSCYVDFVAGRVQRSSYETDPEAYVPLPSRAEDMPVTFARLREETT